MSLLHVAIYKAALLVRKHTSRGHVFCWITSALRSAGKSFVSLRLAFCQFRPLEEHDDDSLHSGNPESKAEAKLRDSDRSITAAQPSPAQLTTCETSSVRSSFVQGQR